VVFEGELKSPNHGPAPVSGPGTRMMWYPDKAAFRVGTVVGNQWDTDSIGTYSTAWGINSKASGSLSTVWGQNTEAAGTWSTAWGSFTEASGFHSTAWGLDTKASGLRSTAWGQNTEASADLSTAWGRDTEASGILAAAWGDESVASGAWSTAWGDKNVASGNESTAWGSGSEASAILSTAWGSNTIASGILSTAWGEDTEASGSRSTAWGDETLASGWRSTAWGISTEAPSYVETALGRYATTYTPISERFWKFGDRLFVIGNGTSSSNRNDALVLLKNGNLGLNLSEPEHRLSLAVTTKPTTERPDGDGLGIVNTGTGRIWNIHMSASWLRFSYANSTLGSRINILGEYIVNSDKRLKTDIASYNKVLGKVLELEVKDYRYKNSMQSQKSIGFIAQDVLPLFPELVSSDGEDDYLGINYSGFSVIAIQAIQEQQQIIDEQNQRLREQEEENLEQKRQMEQMQDQLNQIKAMLEQKNQE
jgi:hypothetical protein